MRASTEKHALPTTHDGKPSANPRSVSTKRLKSICLFACGAAFSLATMRGPPALPAIFDLDRHPIASNEHLCPQASPLLPSLHQDVTDAMSTAKFKAQAVDWLGGAVRCETESYDVMGRVGHDSRWEKFGVFHQCMCDSVQPLEW